MLQTREDKWAGIGRAAPPILSPSYRTLGDGLGNVWVSTYRPVGWTIDRLDARWTHDTAWMPIPKATDIRPKVGDVVVWAGPVDYLYDESGEVIFQPSVITGVGKPFRGHIRIESLRDGWLAVIPLDLAIAARPHLEALSTPDGKGAALLRDQSLLDLWGLDVWCSDCGHLGSPRTQAAADLELSSRDQFGNLNPWPLGLEAAAPSKAAMGDTAMSCERCGREWGRRPIADPTVWPESDIKEPNPVIVGSVDGFLEAIALEWGHDEPCASLQEVADHLSDAVTDPYDSVVTQYWPTSISVTVGGTGWDLEFPFSLGELWYLTRECEGDARAYDTDRWFESRVEALEGFPVALNQGASFPGNWWHEHHFNSYSKGYRYVRKAPDAWSLERWVGARMKGERLGDSFAVPLPDGSDATHEMTLGSIREAWVTNTDG